ncbi:VWA domain-containing protein [Porticoccaceae bacterium]|nr:VWA domain-containing protein [Porticoccaceae bacterium]
MPRKRRPTPFNLSFLDIMACGFGAVTLLFLILRHNAEIVATEQPSGDAQLLAEAVEQQQIEGAQLDSQLAALQQRQQQLAEQQAELAQQLEEQQRGNEIGDNELQQLRDAVAALEIELDTLAEPAFGSNLRQTLGDGDRQYLTGMKLGGERIAILIDGSASMLAEQLINVLRLRNAEPEQQRSAAKWQWTLNIADWLLAQLPASARYQLVVFNQQSQAVLAASEGQWLDAADSLSIERSSRALRNFYPAGGSSLISGIDAIAALEPQPDNLFIITDGLPTLGDKAPANYMVSAQQRKNLFNQALSRLPYGLPVNILLLPMEGDPEAAALYWQLAINSRGSLLTPARDWP